MEASGGGMGGGGMGGGGMGSGGCRSPQGDPNMNPDAAASIEWRSQLQHDARSRIVTKIMDTLEKHLQVSGPEGIDELKKIAIRFEEKVYSVATSQVDYLRKISMKMLSMELKTRGNSAANTLASSSNIVNQTSPDAVELIAKLKSSGDPNMNPDVAGSIEWRSQLQHDARSRIVTMIMDTLEKHLQISGPEGIDELKKIAVRFEEKIYSVATRQADYLWKISMKMLSMEQKTHGNGAANTLASSSNIVNQTSPDVGTL